MSQKIRRILKIKFLWPLLVLLGLSSVSIILISNFLYKKSLYKHALSRSRQLIHFLGTSAQLVHYPYELQRFVYALGSEPHVTFLAIVAGKPLKVLVCNKKNFVGRSWKDLPIHSEIRLPEFRQESECHNFLKDKHVFNYTLGMYLAQHEEQTIYEPAYFIIRLQTGYWQDEFLQRQVKGIALFLSIILIITGLCIWQIDRLILQPLALIKRQMNRYNLGDTSVSIPIQSHDEIGDLAQTLNRMMQSKEKSEGLFQQLSEMAPVLLWTSTADNKKFHFSRKWSEFTGQTQLHYNDWSWLRYFHANVAETYKKAFLEAFAQRKPFTMECQIKHYPANYHWMWSYCMPRFLSNDQFDGYICCLIDISERKKSEDQLRSYAQELAKARDEALKLAQSKSRFFATMSHEIRTPINGILGYVYLLEDTTLTSEQKEYLQSIQSSTQLLLELINQILDFSRIEADKLVLEPIPFDLEASLNTVVDLFQPSLQRKNLSLQIWRHPQLPRHFVGDPKRFRQILMNLLGNAVKFTDKGSIQIRLTGRTLKRNQYQLFVSIKDSGIGIEKKDCETIFKAFQRVPFQNQEGTGLGLSITRSLIELMKGQLHVYSRPHEGSIFYFTIQLEIDTPVEEENVAPQIEIASMPASETGKSILVVEDNEANQKIIKRILKKNGYSVDVVENGYRCLEWLQRHQADVLIMDLNMPQMDGYETTQRIRSGECGLETSALPIIGFTAYAMQETYEQCISIGMNDLLTKPIQPPKLLECIHHWLTIQG